MTFKPGVSGNPSGRPKKLLKRVDEVLHEKKVCPVTEALALLQNGEMPDAARLRGWLELFGYVFPKVKDQAAEGPDDNLHQLSTPELVKRLGDVLSEMKKEAKKDSRKADAA